VVHAGGLALLSLSQIAISYRSAVAYVDPRQEGGPHPRASPASVAKKITNSGTLLGGFPSTYDKLRAEATDSSVDESIGGRIERSGASPCCTYR